MAANLFEQKECCSMVAEAIGVHVQSVRRCWREFDVGGRKALLAVTHNGWPARLNPAQKELIYGW